MESLDGYIDIKPQDFVVLLVARLRRDLEQVTITPSVWWFVIQDLDLTLTAQLVATLSGSMQIGALKKDHQLIMHAYLNDRTEGKPWPNDKNGRPLVEQLENFADLLQRAIIPQGFTAHFSDTPLVLTKAEKKDLLTIHQFRNELSHIKPMSWSLETIGLPRMTLAALKAIKHLFEHSSQIIYLEQSDIDNCDRDLEFSIVTVGNTIAATST